MVELTDRGKAFRSAIAAFIEARRAAKLKGKGNEGDVETASKYDYATWLASAAERAQYLQSVTHVLKATHPSARGSNVYALPFAMCGRPDIGTHSLDSNFVEDTAVSDAKHLDVFAFLKQPFEGRRILDWIRDDDPDLKDALHHERSIANEWVAAFKGLIRSEEKLISNTLAKQVYWLVGEEPGDDDAYHLLQPLLSSSLLHAVHADIQEARFGEVNKLARQALRAKEPHEGPYRDYRNLVARKLGGTKPQNISQLNSERGGVNYLLSSLPPVWRRESLAKLLRQDSAIELLRQFDGVRTLMKTLTDFLLSDPAPTTETRDRREVIEQVLGLQLSVFAASIRAYFPPGWTRDPDCRLPLCEQLWLDPERIELPLREGHDQEDADFIAAYNRGDWPDEVAGRFANWVNERLREAALTTVGDAEHKHWAKRAIVDAAWPAPMQRRTPSGAA